MTDRPHLTVVGGKAAPEPDITEEMAEMIATVAARLADVVRTNGLFWTFTEIEGETAICYYGGKLESSAIAEELAREKKCEALGFHQ